MKKLFFAAMAIALAMSACNSNSSESGKSGQEDKVSSVAKTDAVRTSADKDESSVLWKFDNGKLTSVSGLPLVVDFSATWCPPCQQLKPVFERLADEYREKVTMVSIDVDEYPEIASEFGVSSIPALFFISPDGKVVNSLVGLRDRQEIISAIDQLM